MRYVVILAVLTLAGCALPGASGTNSFMTAMHPTQEFCASRGLTLDLTTKQCVTPPQSAPPAQSPPGSAGPPQHPAAEVTGSLPQAAPGQSQPPPPSPALSAASAPPLPPAVPVPPLLQERQRASGSVPIEPDAVIYAEFRQDFDLMYELAHFVRASGYRCDSISALQSLPTSHGFKLVCNRFNYKYAIEEKDGRSTVTVQ